MTTAALTMPVPNLGHQQVIEQTWQNLLSQLSGGNVEVVLPFKVGHVLGQDGLDAIVARYSALIKARASVLHDSASNSIRIFPPSDVQVGTSSAQTPSISSSSASPAATFNTEDIPAASPDQTPIHSEPAGPPARKSGSKSRVAKSRSAKVPRPANAFILYRQHHHPLVKALHPKMHNNQISVLLGEQWGVEDEDVKESYKSKAEELKKKHFEDHPEYQYQPRKPSEKKRRMTKKKVAEASQASAFDATADSLPTTGATTPIAQNPFNTPSTSFPLAHGGPVAAANISPFSQVELPRIVPDFQTIENGGFLVHDLFPTQNDMFADMIEKHNASHNHQPYLFAHESSQVIQSVRSDEAGDDVTFSEALIDYEALDQQLRAENARFEAECEAEEARAAAAAYNAAPSGDLRATLSSYDEQMERDIANFTSAEDFRMTDLMCDYAGTTFEEVVAAQNFSDFDFTNDAFSSDF